MKMKILSFMAFCFFSSACLAQYFEGTNPNFERFSLAPRIAPPLDKLHPDYLYTDVTVIKTDSTETIKKAGVYAWEATKAKNKSLQVNEVTETGATHFNVNRSGKIESIIDCNNSGGCLATSASLCTKFQERTPYGPFNRGLFTFLSNGFEANREEVEKCTNLLSEVSKIYKEEANLKEITKNAGDELFKFISKMDINGINASHFKAIKNFSDNKLIEGSGSILERFLHDFTMCTRYSTQWGEVKIQSGNNKTIRVDKR